MIFTHPWRLLAVLAGLLGALAACANSGAQRNPGGAPYDLSQPPPERGGGGGGGGGY